MVFARKVWALLVGIKDALVLLFMLLFFVVLYGALSSRPTPVRVTDGALLLKLDGAIVEEPAVVDPLDVILASEAPVREYRARDIERALRLAATDKRIKAVVFDLSRFTGAGFVHLHDIGEAMDAIRKAGKPVLVNSTFYSDDSLLIAAHASEAWIDPMGFAFLSGPGGNQLYFARLIEKLKINAHVFRVGTYKSYVEPYIRSDMSDAARESYQEVYGGLWDAWLADARKARPAVKYADLAQDPVSWVKSANGDMALAAKQVGLVDRLGDETEFGKRVAEIVGEDRFDDGDGAFAHTELADWLAANPESRSGAAIGVVTVAGDIVDGEAGPGEAGGDRIADVLDEAADEDLKALVVRVDSPGGSTIASERIRRAIDRYRQRGIPVVVSMANLAASGGYWVSTPGSRIFADPGTITGSIGVFAVLASFEDTLKSIGVDGDGVRTTPLSGQPDLATGLTPEVASLFQMTVEDTYRRFLTLVGNARDKSPQEADAVAQGRPWDGARARELGLVDEFGDLDAALAYAARKARIGNGKWHAEYLGEVEIDPLTRMLMELYGNDTQAPEATSPDFAGFVARRQNEQLARIAGQVRDIVGTGGARAYCLECPALPRASGGGESAGVLVGLARLVGLTSG